MPNRRLSSVCNRWAGTQVSVSKTVHEGLTHAAAVPIAGDERVREVARMLSGSTSSSALEHARELLGT